MWNLQILFETDNRKYCDACWDRGGSKNVFSGSFSFWDGDRIGGKKYGKQFDEYKVQGLSIGEFMTVDF